MRPIGSYTHQHGPLCRHTLALEPPVCVADEKDRVTTRAVAGVEVGIFGGGDPASMGAVRAGCHQTLALLVLEHDVIAVGRPIRTSDFPVEAVGLSILEGLHDRVGSHAVIRAVKHDSAATRRERRPGGGATCTG